MTTLSYHLSSSSGVQQNKSWDTLHMRMIKFDYYKNTEWETTLNNTLHTAPERVKAQHYTNHHPVHVENRKRTIWKQLLCARETRNNLIVPPVENDTIVSNDWEFVE